MFSEDVASTSAATNDLLFQGAITALELKQSLDLASSWYFPNVLG